MITVKQPTAGDGGYLETFDFSPLFYSKFVGR